MNKRKIIVLITSVILILTAIIISVNVKSNNTTSENSNVIKNSYYIEKETSIAFESKEYVTEERQKKISVSPFEKAEILIDVNIEVGSLNVEVSEQQTKRIILNQTYTTASSENIKINEGLGNYVIKITTEDLVGMYTINWNIEANDNTELYTSTKGYSFKYDPNKFKIINENGTEKFKSVNDENDNYFKIKVLENTKIEDIKNELLNDSSATGECKITNSNMSGIYIENENNNIKKQNMIFEIETDKFLIIEINIHNEQADDFILNEHIKNMINTFKYK